MKHSKDEGEQNPPQVWTMKFCRGCGRNDLQMSLGPRHFSGGKLCTGKIIIVKYKREDLDHARDRSY